MLGEHWLDDGRVEEGGQHALHMLAWASHTTGNLAEARIRTLQEQGSPATLQRSPDGAHPE
jgi:hypothetical protein